MKETKTYSHVDSVKLKFAKAIINDVQKCCEQNFDEHLDRLLYALNKYLGTTTRRSMTYWINKVRYWHALIDNDLCYAFMSELIDCYEYDILVTMVSDLVYRVTEDEYLEVPVDDFGE